MQVKAEEILTAKIKTTIPPSNEIRRGYRLPAAKPATETTAHTGCEVRPPFGPVAREPRAPGATAAARFGRGGTFAAALAAFAARASARRCCCARSSSFSSCSRSCRHMGGGGACLVL